MVHKPKHRVHSFRGLLGDGGEDEINLERQNVNLAYRITKFEIMPHQPGAVSTEHICKIYRESQTTITIDIDFGDPDLLAAAYVNNNTNATAYPLDASTIFDNTLFSRNIFVTHDTGVTSASCNYYIELEEVPVGAATLMQLKLGTARKLIGAKMGG